MSDVQVPSKPIESDLRLVTALVYGLYLFGPFSHGLTAIIGVVIAYVKRADARGTVFESHFANAITVFWAGAIFSLLFLVAVLAGVAGVFSFFGPDFWTAHNWNSHMHHWRWDMQPPVVPHDWWPLIGILPLASFAFIAFGVWYLYRVIRGLVHALENKPY